jgi:acetoin utilization protein AcuC
MTRRPAADDGPLLVYGPWSDRYDFGEWHPLTPKRFGPGIDLLRAMGARPGLAPEPATDADLLVCHTARYLEIVRGFGTDPDRSPAAGIGPFGDCPPFTDMYEISAAVAGGSMRAMEAILRGDAEHAFHPGGGLHHAMAERASGFCIYDDPALAIALARRSGRRVLYLDFDTHHGDGVQALHADDPGVLTFSIHESGRYLFPGTGFADELGMGAAAGTSVNVPLEPWTGEGAWLAAVRSILPELAAAFGPDVIVSQHGCDSHAWDPLAHLRVTTTAMGEAARLVDRLAHRWAAGRWLATGGGGYEIYRVVPRAWALTWLAGAHREAPDAIPAEWRERWAAAAVERGTAPLPARFADEPNAGQPIDDGQQLAELRSAEMARMVRRVVVPRLVREAVDRRWWDPLTSREPAHAGEADPDGEPTIIDRATVADLERLTLAPRVIVAVEPASAAALLRSTLAAGASASLAAIGDVVVGVVVSAPAAEAARTILAVGVSPARRGRGLARELLRRHLAAHPKATQWDAEITVAERDWIDPRPVDARLAVADALFARAGFRRMPADPEVGAIDRTAARYRRA